MMIGKKMTQKSAFLKSNSSKPLRFERKGPNNFVLYFKRYTIMSNLKIKLGILVMSVLFGLQSFGQSTATSNHTLTMGIPEVCLLGTSSAAISLQLTTATAGNQITGGTGTGFAQVSSIVSTGETRTITASVTGVPAGTSLSVNTTPPSGGNSGGVLGTGSTNKSLVNGASAITLVTGIGSCYTGAASTDGYQLDYTWSSSLGAYGSIVASAGVTATVVLTITNIP